jgi:hypothetical protein
MTTELYAKQINGNIRFFTTVGNMEIITKRAVLRSQISNLAVEADIELDLSNPPAEASFDAPVNEALKTSQPGSLSAT